MTGPLGTEEQNMKKLWDMHHEAMRGIREHLAKSGSTMQVDIIIRDKAASERRSKRLARTKR